MNSQRSNSQLASIQILRGVAASLVVLHHFAHAIETYSKQESWIVKSGLGALGAAGVDLFFVISGFIMVYTTRNRVGPQDALSFFYKRARRVFPLYWFWTTVLLLLWLANIALRSHTFPLPYIAASYLLIPAYHGTTSHPLLDQGWTLSFEMLFYIAFATAMIFVSNARRLVVVPVLLTATAVLGALLSSPSAMRDLLTNSLIAEFVLGMLAAEIVVRMQAARAIARPRSPWWPLLLVGAGMLLMLATLAIPQGMYSRGLVWGIPSVLIVLGAALFNDSSRRGLAVYLGDASYSIYLTHGFVALAFGTALQKVPVLQSLQPDGLILGATVATVLLTSLSYPLVEKPLLKLLSRGEPDRKRAESVLGTATIR